MIPSKNTIRTDHNQLFIQYRQKLEQSSGLQQNYEVKKCIHLPFESHAF